MTTLTIARNTFGEAIRKKILLICLLVAMAMIAFAVSFASFTMREELTIIKSFGLGVIAIAGMFMAVILGINLIPQEMERKTIYTILSKPVRRYEFLLGKFFGALATILVSLAVMTVAFMLMVFFKNHYVVDFAMLKGIVMIFFQLLLLTAVALIFSVFTTPVVNFFMTSAVYIIGSLADVTESMSHGTDKNVLVRGFYMIVHYLTPQFANFFTQNPLIHGIVIKNEAVYYSWNILYAIVYSSILLIVAILVFERRDM
jgi:ABC-type transport system involved in multi-copper enzyme maturation permease subunit